MSDTNKVEITGTVKWEPKTFPPREDGHKPIMVFALEYAGRNNRKSVFHFKAYGDLAEELNNESLEAGDKVAVVGALNEAKWKNKQTDEWENRIEVWANKVEFVERVNAGEFGAPAPEDEEIPF